MRLLQRPNYCQDFKKSKKEYFSYQLPVKTVKSSVFQSRKMSGLYFDISLNALSIERWLVEHFSVSLRSNY